jgi:hypothetical protein
MLCQVVGVQLTGLLALTEHLHVNLPELPKAQMSVHRLTRM